MAEFPKRAKVVIVGLGGIVGASVAHHLIERGWDDIVGIDKSGIPTDIGSTAHASDFCYTTSHDFLSCWTTLYSIDFYEKLGHYERIGGLEVARVGDDARMDEIKRKVASAKAFGTRARLIDPAEIKQKFPLIEESMVQGGLWDPDAGLVIPRSQTVAGKLVDQAEASGKLKAFANTPAKSLVIENGRIKGVVTDRGTIEADYVVVCAGLWGRLIAAMAGEDLPVMPVDHPLTFFGPYTEFAGTGKEIGFPLLRDQGNSAYMRDTGDPTTSEGGMIEWGYYEENNPRLCHPRDILEKDQARLSPSQRDLDMEQVLGPLERAIELTPILGELGYDERRSFNGLLQVTADGGPVDRRKPEGEGAVVRRRHLGEGRARHGQARRRLDDRRAHGNRSRQDRLCALLSAPDGRGLHRGPLRRGRAEGLQSGRPSARALCDRPQHPPLALLRAREGAGRLFHGAGRLGARPRLCRQRAPAGEIRQPRAACARTSGTTRHFWRVSNAEHLAMSEDCGIVNLSHFAMFDVEGPDHVALMEWLCAARIGGDANIGKGIYTHFLDDEGMVRADLTVIRMADRCRVVDGADAGPRDFHYVRRVAQDKGLDVTVTEVTEKYVTVGIWGPNARATLQKVVEDPAGLTPENFPFAAIKPVRIAGKDVTAFRISYVGEQGWELHMAYEDGLAVWDALRSTGVIAFGVETYANSRRMEKSLRLQNADLLTEYNLLEADLARPKVKDVDFRGKAKHLEYRARAHQPAMLCTLVMTDNRRFQGRCPLSRRHDAGDGSRNRRDACRRARPAVVHDLGRLRSNHRQEHRARLFALGLLPGRPQADRSSISTKPTPSKWRR